MFKALLFAGLLSGGMGQELCQPGQQGCSAQEWRDHYAAAGYDPRLGQTYASVLNARKAKAAREKLEAQEVAASPAAIRAAQFAAEMFISDLQVCLAKGGGWSLRTLIRDYVKNHDINQPGKEEKTPLITACEMIVSADVIKLFLEAGANASVTDSYGQTALDYVRQYGHKYRRKSGGKWRYQEGIELLENALAQENRN
jgi:hypothetical protein